MRLSTSSNFDQFGSVQIHELQRVIELDAGSGRCTSSSSVVSRTALLAIESQMVIVVLCKNEHKRTIEGVLSGIPHDCLVILVSNSDRNPVDRFQTEKQFLESFCKEADRTAIAIHQKDPGAAKAFLSAGAPDLVAEDGLIHDGKGEGMFLGMALAALTGRQYIGFIDADNYIPGSVHEYCKAYAAGFHLAKTPNAMIRLSWSSKPKQKNGRMVFECKGRSSKVVNHWLNSLLQDYSGYGTECITTGNAGEHAMTMSLGMRLRFASGFAIEPYQYIDLLENLSGMLDNKEKKHSRIPQVHIHQIKTRNPHLHDNKGDDHVQHMLVQALSMIYHSTLTKEAMKQELWQCMHENGWLIHGQVPSQERIYPAIETLDLARLSGLLNRKAESLSFLQGHTQEISTPGRLEIKMSIAGNDDWCR
ncbi:hypothetical protein JX265_013068 [Neoarthrinium moseri]|uniref:Mannosyl-3-phosphoglycerate synthase n=1 Tax=Neoarthrinium moseri TaxID=1658444 RepID=A0A9P9W9K8_9PEZI|nr:uncharacterized protein JN550_005847 [Neoarthrinium moseri]KAI1841921.1 hypothetical protein JX266_011891 [Neoarthrinium moseri]KAI1852215.1 hypothetical protein JX265_013068 [Neoarthrinium moseri]KAI1869217.1 hypothetical protein JN550_005847 [Neoarthrinium moseri]